MAKRYTTVDGLFGTRIHYDEEGRVVGESMPGEVKGTMDHFDADGKYIGTSTPGWDGDTMLHCGADGQLLGMSAKGIFGGTVHADADGHSGLSTDLFGVTLTELDDD